MINGFKGTKTNLSLTDRESRPLNKKGLLPWSKSLFYLSGWRDLQAPSMRKRGTNKIDSLGLGVYLGYVGVERFELSTSRTRTVRSTGLSHTPIGKVSLWGKACELYHCNLFCVMLQQSRLRVKQYHLTIEIEQARHPIVVLSDG